jgi:hypothetical protein
MSTLFVRFMKHCCNRIFYKGITIFYKGSYKHYISTGRRFIAGDYNVKHNDLGSRLIAARGRKVLKTMEGKLKTPIYGRIYMTTRPTGLLLQRAFPITSL